MTGSGRTVALVAFCAHLVGGAAAQAQEVTLKFLTAWDERVVGIEHIVHRYADKVTAASDGRIAFEFMGPDVVPTGQQFEPVSSGVFDLHYTAPNYSIGITGVPFAFLALPPGSEAWRANGYWDFADQELQRFNQKLLAFLSETTEENAFQIILKEPLGDGPLPLDGRKIRGNVFYAPMVAPLGGSIVNISNAETYAALERGVVDGVAWAISASERMGFQELAKYMMRPTFGIPATYVSINLDTFNSLSAEDQALLLEAGRQIEQEAPPLIDQTLQNSLKVFADSGMVETTLPEEQGAALLAGFKSAIWDIARGGNEQSAARVDELREMARKAGDAD